MNNFNFQAMMKYGFLIIPKALLQQQIEDRHIPEGEIEALLKILMKVNYSDTLYNDRQNKNYPCKRGESLFSYRDWSHIFRWSIGKTFRFIHELAALGVIEIVPIPTIPPCTFVSSNTTSGWDPPTAKNRKRKPSTKNSICFGMSFTASRSFLKRISPKHNANGKS